MNIIEFGNIINNTFSNNITSREWNEYENIFKEEINKYEKKENIIFVMDEKDNILISTDYNGENLYKISKKKTNEKYNNNFLLYKGDIEDIDIKKKDNVDKKDDIVFSYRIIQTIYIKKNNEDIIYKVFFNKIYLYNQKNFIYNIKYKILKEKHFEKVFENIVNKRKYVEQINSLKIKVITDMNNLILVKNYKQNSNEIEPNIYMTRPVNVLRKDLPFLKNYLFFPKLDGYHYFVYYHKTGIYYINEKEVIIIKNKEKFINPKVDLSNSIFLGELIKGEIYIFDSLFYKGGNLTKLPLLDRLNYARNTPLKILEFFKTPKEAITFNKNTSLPTDGIICVPTDKFYKNNASFKWKPPDMLTIDFYVKFIKTENNNQIFGLYNYSGSNQFEPFKGHGKNPFSGEIILNSYIYDETITEFYWDGTTFIPHKIRWDKLKPNFISVAINIWEDINNPILEKDICDITIENINLVCHKLKEHYLNINSLRQDYYDFVKKVVLKNKHKTGNQLFDFLKKIII
jgi:hypothetical protein